MNYSDLKTRYDAERGKDDLTGDIVLLNRIVRSNKRKKGALTLSDVEALLFECCPEFADYTAQERKQIVEHTYSLGGGS